MPIKRFTAAGAEELAGGELDVDHEAAVDVAAVGGDRVGLGHGEDDVGRAEAPGGGEARYAIAAWTAAQFSLTVLRGASGLHPGGRSCDRLDHDRSS